MCNFGNKLNIMATGFYLGTEFEKYANSYFLEMVNDILLSLRGHFTKKISSLLFSSLEKPW